ncbi:MAG TPA: 3-dehydroquinate synthase [Aeromicrobium sp.]|nr:3-dehydroquinate synthase [Aeromicrobium sp.]
MTRRITVHTDHPYDVVVGRGIGDQLRELVSTGDTHRVAIIHPRALSVRAQTLRFGLLDTGLQVHLIEVPDGDAAKDADVLHFCWGILGDAGFTRSDVVVGLGGGATTDLAGFVAATWLRGVRFVNVPTTVLGMVDAAVGGKTGINTAHGKNLVGAFYEPIGVLCDLNALQTLPGAELRSGLAEVLKCGFIADTTILDDFENNPSAAMDVTGDLLADLVVRGIKVKADTVANDFRETGADGGIGREALNYGHTLGHAIETFEDHGGMRHGEAISIGMVFVAELAHRTGRIDDAVFVRHRRVLQAAGLPTSYRSDVWDALLATMRLDKKSRGDQLRFVVLQRQPPTSLVPDPSNPPGRTKPVIFAGPDEALLRECYRAVSS